MKTDLKDLDKPIRILHCFGRLDRGGAETLVMNLYRVLDRKKIQFDFVIHTNDHCDFEDEIDNLGGKVYRVPRYNGINHLSYVRAWDSVFEGNFDRWKVVHAHIVSTASIYLQIARRHGIKTIVHSHSTSSGYGISSVGKSFLQRFLSKSADYYLACSEESAKWLFGNQILSKKNFKIINNAIDTNKFTFDENIRVDYRRMLGLSKEYTIGHVGSMFKPKNHMYLLDIFNEIVKNDANVKLVLVGEGSLKNEIIDKIKRYNLSNKVLLLGRREDVSELLNVLDVFVFPSIFEGFPVTLIEAQVSGLKCFVSKNITKTTNVSGNVEFISVKENPCVWAQKIIDYRKDPTHRITEKEKFNKFDTIEVLNELKKIYMSVIVGGGKCQ